MLLHFPTSQGALPQPVYRLKDAFHVLLSYAANWKGHRLLTAKGGAHNQFRPDYGLLEASHLPTPVGTVNCGSHQENNSDISKEITELGRRLELQLAEAWVLVHTRGHSFHSSHLHRHPQILNTSIQTSTLIARLCFTLSKLIYSLPLRICLF